MMTEVTKVRNDLNDMVKSIEFKRVTTRYNSRDIARVTLFNNEVVEFKDTEGLYDLFMAYRNIGKSNFIKSKTLVEEVKNGIVDILDGQVDENTNTYICVLFELENGQKYRLFPSRRYVDRKIIDLYYEQFKQQKAQAKIVQK